MQADNDSFAAFPAPPEPSDASPDRGMVIPESMMRGTGAGAGGTDLSTEEFLSGGGGARGRGGDAEDDAEAMIGLGGRAGGTEPEKKKIEVEQGGEFFVRRAIPKDDDSPLKTAAAGPPTPADGPAAAPSASAAAGALPTPTAGGSKKRSGIMAGTKANGKAEAAEDSNNKKASKEKKKEKAAAALDTLATAPNPPSAEGNTANKSPNGEGGASSTIVGDRSTVLAAPVKAGGLTRSQHIQKYRAQLEEKKRAEAEGRSTVSGSNNNNNNNTTQQQQQQEQHVSAFLQESGATAVKDDPIPVAGPRARPTAGPSKQSAFGTQMQAIWRQHLDRLYDFYAQHFLEYPTSTVSFVPESRVRFPAEYAMHQIYTGTINSRDNYVCAHHCYVPSEIEDEDLELGDADADPNEVGKYIDVANLLQPVIRVAHDGPVQRLRVNPFIPSLIAARGRKNNMSVYQLADYGTQDTNKPPTTTLRGARSAGHGIAWNCDDESLLAATTNDGMVYVYNVNANIEVTAAGEEDDSRRVGSSTGPLTGLAGHSAPVYDCSWHSQQTHTLMSCDAGGKVFFWDTRSMSKEFSAEMHCGAAYSCAFHPTGIYAFATAGEDGLVRVWDYRKLSRPTYNLVGHRGPVLGVKWAPFNNTVLLSNSADGTVILWDLAKVDTEPIPTIDDHMRPEVVFQHFGHMGPVKEAQWCDHPEDPWTVVSVDDYNTVQLWSPAPNAYNNTRFEEDE